MIDEAADRIRRDAAIHVDNGADEALIGDLQNFFANAVQSKPTEITGEHIGRMIGRAAGDEAGIMGGVALGAAIGEGMGWESEKDRQIRQLQEQLALQ